MSLFAFIPSPIFFGSLMDKTCLVWGKTCSGNGNCWLYDGEALRFLFASHEMLGLALYIVYTYRYSMNTIAAAFVAVGCLFDVGVWYYVKDLKIFDDEVVETELKDLSKEEKRTNEIKVDN